jgi:hypothetical protein
MSMINSITRAMAVQVERSSRTHRTPTDADIIADLCVKLEVAQRDLAAAHLEIERLATENERLRASVIHGPGVNAAKEGLFVNGRLVVNQIEAAEILGVKQFKISRWVKAGKFQTVAVPGRKIPMLYADSLHKPERGKPGRKKK